MRNLGLFQGLAGQEHFRGQSVVLQGDRGTELGEVLTLSSSRTDAALGSTVSGEIVRVATEQDHEAMAKLAARNGRMEWASGLATGWLR